MARPKKVLLDEQSETVEEIDSVLLDEQLQYDIEIISDTKHVKVGEEFKVSGNVANILISKGVAKVKVSNN